MADDPNKLDLGSLGLEPDQTIEDYLASEDPRAIARGLTELAEALDEQVSNLRDIAEKVGQVNSPLGRLILAMASPLLAKDAKFPIRLEKDIAEIQALTAYYAQEVLTRPERVFLESGSTTALLALAFHKILVDDRNKDGPTKKIYTNNKAVSDVLCSLCKVWQTPGWADTKYFGVFPFASRNDSIDTDQKNFRDLYCSMKDRVDRLVLEASMLSFLLGPTVRSWQNVCYKAVVYNIPKPIDVLISAAKVITEVGNPVETDSQLEKPTLCWHLTHCYTVFSHPSRQDGVPDGSVLPAIGALEPQKGRGIAFFESVADDLQLKKTWLDLVESNEGIRIWLASPNQREVSRVERHIDDDLNPYLQRMGRPRGWEKTQEKTMSDTVVSVYTLSKPLAS